MAPKAPTLPAAIRSGMCFIKGLRKDLIPPPFCLRLLTRRFRLAGMVEMRSRGFGRGFLLTLIVDRDETCDGTLARTDRMSGV